MKIVFICGSIEPGKDGVGDYTRRLSGELIRQGHEVSMIALNDGFLEPAFIKEHQYSDGTRVCVLRLSSSIKWKERIIYAKEWIDQQNPEWLSLQYVCFGFQKKGLPIGLAHRLKKLGKGRKWHIMFHELWVGEKKNSSIKNKWLGIFQRLIILRMIKKLKPLHIDTNTKIYKQILNRYNIDCQILPIFSNISYRESAKSQLNAIIPDHMLQEREKYVIGTLFGTLCFESWNLKSLLNKLVRTSSSKKVVVASLGRTTQGKDWWKKIIDDYPGLIFLKLGEQNVEFVSFWLNKYTDFGIITTPPELATKSGSFMAFKEHGIPVFCKPASIKLNYEFSFQKDRLLNIIYEDGSELILPARAKPVSLIHATVAQFIRNLN